MAARVLSIKTEDVTGMVLADATVQAILCPPRDNEIMRTETGVIVETSPDPVVTDNNGAASLSLYPTVLLSPVGAKWEIVISHSNGFRWSGKISMPDADATLNDRLEADEPDPPVTARRTLPLHSEKEGETITLDFTGNDQTYKATGLHLSTSIPIVHEVIIKDVNHGNLNEFILDADIINRLEYVTLGGALDDSKAEIFLYAEGHFAEFIHFSHIEDNNELVVGFSGPSSTAHTIGEVEITFRRLVVDDVPISENPSAAGITNEDLIHLLTRKPLAVRVNWVADQMVTADSFSAANGANIGTSAGTTFPALPVGTTSAYLVMWSNMAGASDLDFSPEVENVFQARLLDTGRYFGALDAQFLNTSGSGPNALTVDGVDGFYYISQSRLFGTVYAEVAQLLVATKPMWKL